MRHGASGGGGEIFPSLSWETMVLGGGQFVPESVSFAASHSGPLWMQNGTSSIKARGITAIIL